MGGVEEGGAGVTPRPQPLPSFDCSANSQLRTSGGGRGARREVAVDRPPTPPGHEVHRVGNQWYLYVIYRRKENDGKEKRKRKYLGNINGPRT